MKLKLIALDIDGTLTNDEKKITADTLSTLLKFQEQGIRVMLASARPVPGLYSAASELRLGDHHGILMAYNGGKVVDATDGQLLSQTHMDLNKTRELLLFLEALPVTVILDDGERFYVEDAHGYKVEYECWNNQMDCTEVDNLADFLDFSPVKLLLSVDPDEILNIQDMIRSHLPDDLCVVRTAPFYLEIITVISTIMLIRSGTEENLLKKRELWKYIKDHDIRLFHHLRAGIMGNAMNLPGKGGRKISVAAYRLSQKVVGFY